MNASLLLLSLLLAPAESAIVSSVPSTEGQVGAVGRYRMSGKRELMPVAISDDGLKTYMAWSVDQPLPAVFSIDRLGREEMVNGYMRGDLFVIDRVYDRLTFRIDKAQATATRLREGH